MKRVPALLILLLGIGTFAPGLAQPETGLFTDTTILELELKLDIRTVLKDIGEDRVYHPATLSYLDNSGEKIWLPLKVKTRGKTRRKPEICSFPPIWFNFKKSETTGSIF